LLRGRSFYLNSGQRLFIDFFVFHFGDDFPEDSIEALAEVPHTSLVAAVVVDDLAEGGVGHLDLFHLTRVHWLWLYGARGGRPYTVLLLGGSETVLSLETWN
jgi:hypothetical protein